MGCPGARVLLGFVVLPALLGWHAVALDDAARPAGASRPELEFLERHWRRPIAPQGEPPERFTATERSLAPEDCGLCHPTQWEDWRSSIHSKSMGPGVAGQLVEMERVDPGTARSCLACHAPLAEQSPVRAGPAGLELNPDFDAELKHQGVVCAGCHVRGHQRFGPPPRPGTAADHMPRETLPHNGATFSSAYLRSEFCASCHQFAPNGLSLNGKPLENTYEEWRASPAARRGQQCQDCHMPDRRHRWRGIHDPDMVTSGVHVTLTTDRERYRPGQTLRARVAVSNTGVGHYFPTYVTPRVIVRVLLLDEEGKPLPGSVEEGIIGRHVTLDLSREIADTRIAPGGRFVFRYARRLDHTAVSLRVTVTVFPDHFYTGFFETVLEEGAGRGEAQIRDALQATRRSAFEIFSRDVPLT